MKNKLKIWITALILNIIWEFSHYHLYQDLSGISKIPHLLLASVTDATIITITLVILKIKKQTDYLKLTIITLTIAIIIELVNLNLKRWEYTSQMPTILNLGISPLLQLTITAILTAIIVKNLKKKHENQAI